MAEYLDLATWPRRTSFEHFRGFEQPFFSVTTRVDVGPLMAAVASTGSGMLALAYHFLALRLANRHPPFRLRLEAEGAAARVRVHEQVHGSATVLREDGSFGFAHLPWLDDFEAFAAAGRAGFDAARRGETGFDPRPDESAVVYFTTLPWVHFTSFTHARPVPARESIPRIAFGRIDAEPGSARRWLPLAIDAHHALMDGLHVGRYVQDFEAALAAPQAWLSRS